MLHQFERVTQYLESAEDGAWVSNSDNGRAIEVTGMAGGRYLCTEYDEPCRQTDDEAIAYGFLMGRI